MTVAHDFPRAPAPLRWLDAAAELPARATARWRSLPTFLVIGAQRAGTTSLTRALERHPRAFAARSKEVHYFDLHYGRGLDWYRARFPLFGGRRFDAIGEATPYYLFHPDVPGRVRAALPGVRLVCLLRDPVERAWSHFHHERRFGYEPLADFRAALEAEPERLTGEEQRLRTDPTAFSTPHNHFSYLARGDYARQLARWFEHFDRDRLLVLRSEDLFRAPGPELERLCAHLGLEGLPPGELPRFNHGRTPDLPADLRARLVRHFEPLEAELAALLGRPFGWGDLR